MKNVIKCRIKLILLILLLSSCSKVSATNYRISSNTKIPSKTQNIVSSKTLSITSGTTSMATITPTVGPPANLELLNISIFPEHDNMVGDNYYILGRIRNNSDQTMVFFWDDIVFKFKLDAWQRNKNIDGTYRGFTKHSQYIDKAIRGGENSRSMNCLLYPGEEGVYYYHSLSNRAREDYIILFEEEENYNGPFGLSILAYESYYRTNPNIPLYLHPKAKNLSFQKIGESLDFEYDVVDMPERMGTSYDFVHVNSWVTLYDNEGRIINVLYRDLGTMGGLVPGKDYHVHGNTAASIKDKEKYFESIRNITSEMIAGVDRIEVLTEWDEGDMCVGHDIID